MKTKMTALLLASGVVLAACGQDDSGDKDKKANNEKTEQKQSGDTSSTSETGKNSKTIKLDDIKISPEQAIKTAKKAFEGEVKAIAFEKEKGKWVYKVDMHKKGKEAEVVINSQDGKVMHQSTEKENDYDKKKSFEYEDFKTYKEVIKKAQETYSGDIHEWSLSKDDDQNKFVYDIDLQKGNNQKEISIDAKTGKVLSKEKDE